jgi:hypothetical protein
LWGATSNRCTCIKWPDIISQKRPSVAHRSRHIISIFSILDIVFIDQSDSNVLCFIFHRNETEPAWDGRRAPWSSAVRLRETSKYDGQKSCSFILGYNHILYASRERSVGFRTGFRMIQPPILCVSISLSSYCITLFLDEYY